MTILVGIFLRVQVGPKYPFCRPFWEGALVWVWALVWGPVWGLVWERALVESILQVWWMVQGYIYKGYVYLEAMSFPVGQPLGGPDFPAIIAINKIIITIL